MQQVLAAAFALLGVALVFAVDKVIPANTEMTIFKTIRQNNTVVGAACVAIAAYYFMNNKPGTAASTSVASSVPTSQLPSSAAPTSVAPSSA